jgi:Fe-S-cluster containining protein
MEINDCAGCVASCCKLLIDITEKEYLHLKSLNLSKNLLRQSQMFTQQNPAYKGKEDFLDKMYKDDFATIKKSDDGFCSLLDRKTRLCSIYNNRPKCCKDYESNGKRCQKIKKNV